MLHIDQSSSVSRWNPGRISRTVGQGVGALLLLSARSSYASVGRSLLNCPPAGSSPVSGMAPPATGPVAGGQPIAPPPVATQPPPAVPPTVATQPPAAGVSPIVAPQPPVTAPPAICLPATPSGLNCAFQALQQNFIQSVASGALPVFPNGGATDPASYAAFVTGQWTQAFNELSPSDLQHRCVPSTPAPSIPPVAPPVPAPAPANEFPLGIYVQPPSPLPRDGFLVAVGHQNLTAPVDPIFAEICLSNFASQVNDGCANGGLRLSIGGSQTPLGAMNIAIDLAKNAVPGDPADNQDAATALLVAYTRLLQGVGDTNCARGTLSQALRDVINQQNVVSLVQSNAANFNSDVVTTFEDVLRSVTHSPPFTLCNN